MRKAWRSAYYKRITIQAAPTIRAGHSIYSRSFSPLSNAIATSLRCFSTQTHKAANILETPRTLLPAGFPVIQTNQPIEEEELPDYKSDRFYPVKLGEIFQERYQAIAKFGFGTSSTTWLARDLRDRQYVALKVHVHKSLVHRELPFYHHIRPPLEKCSPRERANIRRLSD